MTIAKMQVNLLSKNLNRLYFLYLFPNAFADIVYPKNSVFYFSSSKMHLKFLVREEEFSMSELFPREMMLHRIYTSSGIIYVCNNNNIVNAFIVIFLLHYFFFYCNFVDHAEQKLTNILSPLQREPSKVFHLFQGVLCYWFLYEFMFLLFNHAW